MRPEPVELPEPTEPACALRAAVLAGPVDLAGAAYSTTDPAAARCYPTGTASGAASLVAVRDRGRTVTVVGDAAPFTNDVLDERGNAALALRRARRPPASCSGTCRCRRRPSPGQERGTSELLPPGWVWAPVQLLVAGLASRCGGGGASGAWSPRTCRSSSRPARPCGAGPGSTAAPGRATGPRPPCAPTPAATSPGVSGCRAAPGTAPSPTPRPARTGWPAAGRGRPARRTAARRTTPSLVALAGELDRLRAAVREASGAATGGA